MNVIHELHQFEDGLRPVQPSPAHAWNGSNWLLDAASSAMQEKQESERLCVKVDTAADSARKAIVGDPLRALEYAQATTDAQAFKDENYPKHAVPQTVSAGVIKGRSAKQAADRILLKAARCDESLLTLRTLRLKAKEQIRSYTTKGKTALAREAADEVIIAIRKVVSDYSD